MVIDIDDWELGFQLASYEKDDQIKIFKEIKIIVKELRKFFLKPESSICWSSINEKLLFFADGITVSNTFLKNRFSGKIISHARGENLFNPVGLSRYLIKKKYDIKTNDKLIVFIGTIHPHKGIEDLLIALKKISDVTLIISGGDCSFYSQNLILKARIILRAEELNKARSLKQKN